MVASASRTGVLLPGACAPVWQADRHKAVKRTNAQMASAGSGRAIRDLQCDIVPLSPRLASKVGSFQLTWSLTPHLHTGAFARLESRTTHPLARGAGCALYGRYDLPLRRAMLARRMRRVYVDPFDRTCLGLDATETAASQPQPGRSCAEILAQGTWRKRKRGRVSRPLGVQIPRNRLLGSWRRDGVCAPARALAGAAHRVDLALRARPASCHWHDAPPRGSNPRGPPLM